MRRLQISDIDGLIEIVNGGAKTKTIFFKFSILFIEIMKVWIIKNKRSIKYLSFQKLLIPCSLGWSQKMCLIANQFRLIFLRTSISSFFFIAIFSVFGRLHSFDLRREMTIVIESIDNKG